MTQLLFLDPLVNILLVVVIALISLLFIYLLIRGIKKSKVFSADEKALDGVFTKEKMADFVLHQIEHTAKRKGFSLVRIDINDYAALLESYGVKQVMHMEDIIRTRLVNSLTLGCKLGQNGSGSFLMYLSTKHTDRELEEIGKFLLEETTREIVLAGALNIEPRINIGLAVFPDSGKSEQTLLGSLDLALAVSKRKASNNYVVHTPQLSNKESAEYKHYAEIKEAIDNKRFLLYYQPIIDTKTQEVWGVEALLRWHSETQGILPPSEFLKIIDSSGDLYWLGIWSFEQMLMQCKSWMDSYPDKKIKFFMNLSAKQMLNENLVEDFRRVARKHKVDEDRICLDVPEATFFDNIEAINKNIERLRQAGFGVSLDNYGGSGGNLSALESIEVDIIKLDRHYLAKAKESMLSSGILGAMAEFAKEKSIAIVAQGIEEEADIDYSEKIGINYCQGYFYSQPTTATDCMSKIVMTPWKSN